MLAQCFATEQIDTRAMRPRRAALPLLLWTAALGRPGAAVPSPSPPSRGGAGRRDDAGGLPRWQRRPRSLSRRPPPQPWQEDKDERQQQQQQQQQQPRQQQQQPQQQQQQQPQQQRRRQLQPQARGQPQAERALALAGRERVPRRSKGRQHPPTLRDRYKVRRPAGRAAVSGPARGK